MMFASAGFAQAWRQEFEDAEMMYLMGAAGITIILISLIILAGELAKRN